MKFEGRGWQHSSISGKQFQAYRKRQPETKNLKSLEGAEDFGQQRAVKWEVYKYVIASDIIIVRYESTATSEAKL